MRQEVVQAMIALDASKDEASSAIDSRNIICVSVQVVTTGTSTGTLKLQFSNDITNPSIPPAAPANWIDIPSATVTIAAAGAVGIPITNVCYEFIRAVFTHTNAAAGTISVNIKALGD